MADPKKETKDTRTRQKSEAYDSTRTGDDPSFVAVNTLPTKESASTAERITPGITGEDRARSRAETEHSPASKDKPMTEKIKGEAHKVKEDVKEAVGAKPETDEERRRRMEQERTAVVLPPRTATTTSGATKGADWDQIQHPGMEPCDEDPYGTRPVSELTRPTEVKDKADLAATRMLDREKAERDRQERERKAAAGITAVAATHAATTRRETTTKETTRIEPVTATPTRPVTGVVVPPGTTTTTPLKPSKIVDEQGRMHAEDPSMHPDWETQPQINAPQDVGIPTAEGQADAARLRAGGRRSDTAKEPRIDRRGGEYDVPLASGAKTSTTTTRDDRSMTEKAKDEAYKVKEETKMKAREVKEDVDRKI